MEKQLCKLNCSYGKVSHTLKDYFQILWNKMKIIFNYIIELEVLRLLIYNLIILIYFLSFIIRIYKKEELKRFFGIVYIFWTYLKYLLQYQKLLSIKWKDWNLKALNNISYKLERFGI